MPELRYCIPAWHGQIDTGARNCQDIALSAQFAHLPVGAHSPWRGMRPIFFIKDGGSIHMGWRHDVE